MTMHLQLHDIKVVYGASSRTTAAAVNGLSLSLAAGEVGCLFGPSGCGKTSVLRAIAGLEPIVQGRILVGDAVIASPQLHVQPERRRIGMMFQDMALFPHLTAAENIAFGLRTLAFDHRKVRVNELLQMVGLERAGSKYPHELSGGQQQRVALARTLAPAPSLILLDEPFSSLDRDLRTRLASEVRRIIKSLGQTALLVTHDEREADVMADRIGVMHEGSLANWSSQRCSARAANQHAVELFSPLTK